MSINARDGGTDANDWAEMLLRMYTAWAQKNDYDVVLLERQDNDQSPAFNHATIAIRGPMAYGYLKGETGMHRLVRISPSTPKAKRQTSFAAVDVSPEVNDDIEIKVDWDRGRSRGNDAGRGAGGQHVNKTESCVRSSTWPRAWK